MNSLHMWNFMTLNYRHVKSCVFLDINGWAKWLLNSLVEN
uniref:Uncharacterized protein n=1 Tax=Rhizophora mucronata TaxID=61149 RepID=A0A2P2PUW0_RHIMU